jgi:hypothetical protein
MEKTIDACQHPGTDDARRKQAQMQRGHARAAASKDIWFQVTMTSPAPSAFNFVAHLHSQRSQGAPVGEQEQQAKPF